MTPVADYVGALSEELSRLALNEGYSLLSYLLSMAAHEAKATESDLASLQASSAVVSE